MQILDHIRKFADITPAVEESLRAVIREKHFSKGDTIRGAVNLTSYAHYITSGSARLFYTHKSKEHTVSFSFENGFIVISRHVVMNLPDTVSIQFLEPTTVLTMPHLKVKDILDDVGKVSDTAGLLFLSTALMQYVAFLEERVSVMQSLGAEERYQWLLHRYPRITECANATQIASYLGITKETLYRIRGGKYASTSKRKKLISE